MNSVEEVFWAELAQIQTETIGWILIREDTHIRIGSDEPIIQVARVAKAEMADSNVLWPH